MIINYLLYDTEKKISIKMASRWNSIKPSHNTQIKDIVNKSNSGAVAHTIHLGYSDCMIPQMMVSG